MAKTQKQAVFMLQGPVSLCSHLSLSLDLSLSLGLSLSLDLSLFLDLSLISSSNDAESLCSHSSHAVVFW